MISESRIKTIMDRIRVCAIQASDDPSERVARLGDEIDRLTYELARVETERKRIQDGGPVISVDAPPHARGVRQRHGTALPSSPATFSESKSHSGGCGARSSPSSRLRRGSKGDILGTYVERTDNLLLETAEGKAFDGALNILQDDGAMRELNSQLAAIIAHPFASELSPRCASGVPQRGGPAALRGPVTSRPQAA